MSNRLPTLRQLCFLISLEKHKHFSRAAKECFVAQPTFSIAIKELEGLLGISLAERSNRCVILTVAGRQAAARARKILIDTEELMNIAPARRGELSGTLRLGVIPTVAPFTMPRALKKILRKYTNLDLRIKEGFTDDIYQNLVEGELDLILVALPYDFENVDILTLFKDPFMFAHCRKSRLFKSNRYSEQFLPDASVLLLQDGHCLRGHVISACQVKYKKKINPYTTSSLETLTQMVDNDLGVTFIPKLVANSQWFKRTNIKLLPMPKNAYREIGFVWKKGAVRESEFRLFADFFRKFAPD